MISIRIDIKKPEGYIKLSEVLEKHVGICGKHWFFEMCNQAAYGVSTDEEMYKKWNTMYLIDIKIRSHKKATMFSLAWKD